MNKDDILQFYKYNYWATSKVLNAAARISTEQFIAPMGLTFGSIRGSLVHALGAEIIWRMRFQEGISLSALPAKDEFPDINTLTEDWKREETLMRTYLHDLTDADLTAIFKYKNTKGVPFEDTLWHLLVHVVNHGTQFRSDAAVGLTQLNQSPGDLDMLLYFRESQKFA